ncbi:fructuronate reductase [Methylopila capsulata]|uniref:Fructuronate reductase n=1 Tax=Methylopila capsulata TaxID=61654 RepID=A0A9W6MSX7_9HYPH|nr:mannitol dehydrogenase family protein [Methylopila capsulata]MBM7852596.1 fructuronate reductase [Methylopila capsulata]GLK56803.1 mannitol dehydrogenase [Methylopila capsulata]
MTPNTAHKIDGGAAPKARLNADALALLPAQVGRPSYERRAVSTGIVHLGVGAFHRAHQAVYTDDLLARDPNWGITAASLRNPDTRDALGPQDGLYTLLVRDGAGDAPRVIGSITRLLAAPDDREELLRTMADPGVRIVSLTVTEKGYCHRPSTGELNEDHADIRHDLENPHAPRSAPGIIVEALLRRRKAGAAPFTVLACDNLPSNGRVAKRVIARLAALRDAGLGAWVESELAAPCTMVDRIVPATTDADRARVAEALGVEDAWPVTAEPFSQWVIEDRFPTGRPAWETVGAEIVADVEPYENMKLRLLNGSHSIMAYLGYLMGYETIAEAASDETLAALVGAYMDNEATPTIAVPAEADVEAYKRALFKRWRNPALRHRTWQVAMDGSQKLPQRLVAVARERLAAGAPIDASALGLAAWMRYATGVDERGAPIDVQDPLGPRLRAIADAAGPVAERLAPAMIGVREVFGDDLPRDPRFVEAVTRALARLYDRGAAATVAAYGGA